MVCMREYNDLELLKLFNSEGLNFREYEETPEDDGIDWCGLYETAVKKGFKYEVKNNIWLF